MLKEIRVIKPFLSKRIKNNGYINANYIQMNNKGKMAELSQIFRDSKYETFRILYMKRNTIIGDEIVNSKIPYLIRVFKHDIRGIRQDERGINLLKEHMKKLKANGYYIVRYNRNKAIRILNNDIRLTRVFHSKINGFRGHFILGEKEYVFIGIENGNIKLIKNQKIKQLSKINQKRIEEKGLKKFQIKRHRDIEGIINNIDNSKLYSIMIITDKNYIPKMVFDISNKYLNKGKEELKKHLKVIHKDVNIFLVTNECKVFKEIKKLKAQRILQDIILYKNINGKLVIYEINKGVK